MYLYLLIKNNNISLHLKPIQSITYIAIVRQSPIFKLNSQVVNKIRLNNLPNS